MEPLSRTVSNESARSSPTASHMPPASNNGASSSAFPSALSSEADAASISIVSCKSAPPQLSATVNARRPSNYSGNGSGNGETEFALTLEAVATQPLALPDAAAHLQSSRPKPDAYSEEPKEQSTSHRLSLSSSLYSLGSAIMNMNSSRGLSGPASIEGSDPAEAPSQSATTATSAISVTTSTTSNQNANLGPSVSPAHFLAPSDQSAPAVLSTSPQSAPPTVSPSTSPGQADQTLSSENKGAPQTSQSVQNPPIRRSRSRTAAQRRISGSTGTSSSPGGRDAREPKEPKKPTKGIIGVCALESKARSKPARNIFGKLTDDFEIKIFGDKIILDEDVENWPVCDFLISFFSDGFPLDKAIAYARLRKPFCVNDLPMQQVLWDRRLCLQILDKLNVPTPRRVDVTRDGGPKLPSADLAKNLYDRTGVTLPGPPDGTGGGLPPPTKVELIDDGNTLRVDGNIITKPFVEKPVSGEDHNINIYYHSQDGGGGRRLFRKVNNKSSAKDDNLHVPRSITDPTSSYIYEKFLQVENSEDVKAYTVGPSFCHAETRKSPVVDGLVKRNPSGKEVRYVTELTDSEAAIASRISEGFGQRVCGFDLLRCGDRSYVIDVNGWSFVKDNESYYDKAATIMRKMFINEVERKERKEALTAAAVDSSEAQDKTAGVSRKSTTSHRETLKGIFKSPSMSKLGHHAAHIPHPLIRSGHHSSNVLSPDESLDGTPIPTSPGFEKPYGDALARAPTLPKSDTDLPLPPLVREEEMLAEKQSSMSDEQVNVPPPASKAQWKLKGVVSVIRHADRTPKQKFKYTFHTKPFVDLLKGHQEEVLIIGEAPLQSVADAVKVAIKEGIEDPIKLRELQISLNKKGSWPGTKVQIKPMFRKRRKEELLPGQIVEDSSELIKAEAVTPIAEPSELDSSSQPKRSDSMSGVTLSRISAAENNLILDKLQLIIKWGGEPTHSARHQAQDMAANFRNDLMLMNKEVLDDVSIFSSSERRVTTSAQIFGSSFLQDKNYGSENIQIRKDLLDDSNAAKDVMDKVKKKLKTLLRAGDKAPPQFVWPKDTPEPYIVVRQVVDLMKFHQRVMNHNYKKIESGAVSSLGSALTNPSDLPPAGSLSQATSVTNIQNRWCCNEGPELFKERWEKLFKEFGDADKVDPSKISELYDTMKFDALHNRQFLEWVFTPDATSLDEDAIAIADNGSMKSAKSGKSSVDIRSKTSSEGSKEQSKEVASEKTAEKGSMAQRMGFRRRSEVATKPPPNPSYPHETYFKLFTGPKSAGASRAQVDARLAKLRDMYHLCKVLFDYIGPQEYGIGNEEKLEIGLLTSLPLLKEIVEDLEELQASDNPKSFFYFTKESHIYTLLNCILEGGIKTKIERNAIPELDYLSQIGFELYESENVTLDDVPNTFNYSIRITLSPGCHAFAPLDVQLDSRHMIGFSPRRSLTAHHDWKEVLETLRAKFHTVKLPKSFVAINLSEKVPGAFGLKPDKNDEAKNDKERQNSREDKQIDKQMAAEAEAAQRTALKEDGILEAAAVETAAGEAAAGNAALATQTKQDAQNTTLPKLDDKEDLGIL